jgi:hypothetical protein
VKIHRDIGVDKQSYLCLTENEYSTHKDCPVCTERAEMARRRVDQKEVDALRPNTSLFIYLIDRSNESQGPQLWGMSNRSDAEIISQSLEKRQQLYLPVAHPIDGYDVEFTREGEGLLTRYRGFKVARTSSPLTDDTTRFEEWLNYIEDNPIPDILQFFPAERIKLVFHGKVDSSEEETPPVRIREIPPDRTRPTPQEVVIQPRGNGHDEPPFDTTAQAPNLTPPLRREPLPASEHPIPHEVSESPTERRRATLETPQNNGTPEDVKNRLRERLSQHR